MSWKPGKWRREDITCKQEDFIEAIAEELNTPFNGDNRGDASDYIDKMASAFYESKQKKRVGRPPKSEPKVIPLKRKEKGVGQSMTLETALNLAAMNGVTFRRPLAYPDKNGNLIEQPVHVTINPDYPGEEPIEIDGIDNFVKYMEKQAKFETAE